MIIRDIPFPEQKVTVACRVRRRRNPSRGVCGYGRFSNLMRRPIKLHWQVLKIVG